MSGLTRTRTRAATPHGRRASGRTSTFLTGFLTLYHRKHVGCADARTGQGTGEGGSREGNEGAPTGCLCLPRRACVGARSSFLGRPRTTSGAAACDKRRRRDTSRSRPSKRALFLGCPRTSLLAHFLSTSSRLCAHRQEVESSVSKMCVASRCCTPRPLSEHRLSQRQLKRGRLSEASGPL